MKLQHSAFQSVFFNLKKDDSQKILSDQSIVSLLEGLNKSLDHNDEVFESPDVGSDSSELCGLSFQDFHNFLNEFCLNLSQLTDLDEVNLQEDTVFSPDSAINDFLKNLSDTFNQSTLSIASPSNSSDKLSKSSHKEISSVEDLRVFLSDLQETVSSSSFSHLDENDDSLDQVKFQVSNFLSSFYDALGSFDEVSTSLETNSTTRYEHTLDTYGEDAHVTSDQSAHSDIFESKLSLPSFTSDALRVSESSSKKLVFEKISDLRFFKNKKRLIAEQFFERLDGSIALDKLLLDLRKQSSDVADIVCDVFQIHESFDRSQQVGLQNLLLSCVNDVGVLSDQFHSMLFSRSERRWWDGLFGLNSHSSSDSLQFKNAIVTSQEGGETIYFEMKLGHASEFEKIQLTRDKNGKVSVSQNFLVFFNAWQFDDNDVSCPLDLKAFFNLMFASLSHSHDKPKIQIADQKKRFHKSSLLASGAVLKVSPEIMDVFNGVHMNDEIKEITSDVRDEIKQQLIKTAKDMGSNLGKSILKSIASKLSFGASNLFEGVDMPGLGLPDIPDLPSEVLPDFTNISDFLKHLESLDLPPSVKDELSQMDKKFEDIKDKLAVSAQEVGDVTDAVLDELSLKDFMGEFDDVKKSESASASTLSAAFSLLPTLYRKIKQSRGAGEVEFDKFDASFRSASSVLKLDSLSSDFRVGIEVKSARVAWQVYDIYLPNKDDLSSEGGSTINNEKLQKLKFLIQMMPAFVQDEFEQSVGKMEDLSCDTFDFEKYDQFLNKVKTLSAAFQKADHVLGDSMSEHDYLKNQLTGKSSMLNAQAGQQINLLDAVSAVGEERPTSLNELSHARTYESIEGRSSFVQKYGVLLDLDNQLEKKFSSRLDKDKLKILKLNRDQFVKGLSNQPKLAQNVDAYRLIASCIDLFQKIELFLTLIEGKTEQELSIYQEAMRQLNRTYCELQGHDYFIQNSEEPFLQVLEQQVSQLRFHMLSKSDDHLMKSVQMERADQELTAVVGSGVEISEEACFLDRQKEQSSFVMGEQLAALEGTLKGWQPGRLNSKQYQRFLNKMTDVSSDQYIKHFDEFVCSESLSQRQVRHLEQHCGIFSAEDMSVMQSLHSEAVVRGRKDGALQMLRLKLGSVFGKNSLAKDFEYGRVFRYEKEGKAFVDVEYRLPKTQVFDSRNLKSIQTSKLHSSSGKKWLQRGFGTVGVLSAAVAGVSATVFAAPLVLLGSIGFASLSVLGFAATLTFSSISKDELDQICEDKTLKQYIKVSPDGKLSLDPSGNTDVDEAYQSERMLSDIDQFFSQQRSQSFNPFKFSNRKKIKFLKSLGVEISEYNENWSHSSEMLAIESSDLERIEGLSSADLDQLKILVSGKNEINTKEFLNQINKSSLSSSQKEKVLKKFGYRPFKKVSRCVSDVVELQNSDRDDFSMAVEARYGTQFNEEFFFQKAAILSMGNPQSGVEVVFQQDDLSYKKSLLLNIAFLAASQAAGNEELQNAVSSLANSFNDQIQDLQASAAEAMEDYTENVKAEIVSQLKTMLSNVPKTVGLAALKALAPSLDIDIDIDLDFGEFLELDIDIPGIALPDLNDLDFDLPNFLADLDLPGLQDLPFQSPLTWPDFFKTISLNLNPSEMIQVIEAMLSNLKGPKTEPLKKALTQVLNKMTTQLQDDLEETAALKAGEMVSDNASLKNLKVIKNILDFTSFVAGIGIPKSWQKANLKLKDRHVLQDTDLSHYRLSSEALQFKTTQGHVDAVSATVVEKGWWTRFKSSLSLETLESSRTGFALTALHTVVPAVKFAGVALSLSFIPAVSAIVSPIAIPLAVIGGSAILGGALIRACLTRNVDDGPQTKINNPRLKKFFKPLGALLAPISLAASGIASLAAFSVIAVPQSLGILGLSIAFGPVGMAVVGFAGLASLISLSFIYGGVRRGTVDLPRSLCSQEDKKKVLDLIEMYPESIQADFFEFCIAKIQNECTSFADFKEKMKDSDFRDRILTSPEFSTYYADFFYVLTQKLDASRLDGSHQSFIGADQMRVIQAASGSHGTLLQALKSNPDSLELKAPSSISYRLKEVQQSGEFPPAELLMSRYIFDNEGLEETLVADVIGQSMMQEGLLESSDFLEAFQVSDDFKINPYMSINVKFSQENIQELELNIDVSKVDEAQLRKILQEIKISGKINRLQYAYLLKSFPDFFLKPSLGPLKSTLDSDFRKAFLSHSFLNEEPESRKMSALSCFMDFENASLSRLKTYGFVDDAMMPSLLEKQKSRLTIKLNQHSRVMRAKSMHTKAIDERRLEQLKKAVVQRVNEHSLTSHEVIKNRYRDALNKSNIYGKDPESFKDLQFIMNAVYELSAESDHHLLTYQDRLSILLGVLGKDAEENFQSEFRSLLRNMTTYRSKVHGKCQGYLRHHDDSKSAFGVKKTEFENKQLLEESKALARRADVLLFMGRKDRLLDQHMKSMHSGFRKANSRSRFLALRDAAHEFNLLKFRREKELLQANFNACLEGDSFALKKEIAMISSKCQSEPESSDTRLQLEDFLRLKINLLAKNYVSQHGENADFQAFMHGLSALQKPLLTKDFRDLSSLVEKARNPETLNAFELAYGQGDHFQQYFSALKSQVESQSLPIERYQQFFEKPEQLSAKNYWQSLLNQNTVSAFAQDIDIDKFEDEIELESEEFQSALTEIESAAMDGLTEAGATGVLSELERSAPFANSDEEGSTYGEDPLAEIRTDDHALAEQELDADANIDGAMAIDEATNQSASMTEVDSDSTHEVAAEPAVIEAGDVEYENPVFGEEIDVEGHVSSQDGEDPTAEIRAELERRMENDHELAKEELEAEARTEAMFLEIQEQLDAIQGPNDDDSIAIINEKIDNLAVVELNEDMLSMEQISELQRSKQNTLNLVNGRLKAMQSKNEVEIREGFDSVAEVNKSDSLAEIKLKKSELESKNIDEDSLSSFQVVELTKVKDQLLISLEDRLTEIRSQNVDEIEQALNSVGDVNQESTVGEIQEYQNQLQPLRLSLEQKCGQDLISDEQKEILSAKITEYEQSSQVIMDAKIAHVEEELRTIASEAETLRGSMEDLDFAAVKENHAKLIALQQEYEALKGQDVAAFNAAKGVGEFENDFSEQLESLQVAMDAKIAHVEEEFRTIASEAEMLRGSMEDLDFAAVKENHAKLIALQQEYETLKGQDVAAFEAVTDGGDFEETLSYCTQCLQDSIRNELASVDPEMLQVPSLADQQKILMENINESGDEIDADVLNQSVNFTEFCSKTENKELFMKTGIIVETELAVMEAEIPPGIDTELSVSVQQCMGEVFASPDESQLKAGALLKTELDKKAESLSAKEESQRSAEDVAQLEWLETMSDVLSIGISTGLSYYNYRKVLKQKKKMQAFQSIQSALFPEPLIGMSASYGRGDSLDLIKSFGACKREDLHSVMEQMFMLFDAKAEELGLDTEKFNVLKSKKAANDVFEQADMQTLFDEFRRLVFSQLAVEKSEGDQRDELLSVMEKITGVPLYEQDANGHIVKFAGLTLEGKEGRQLLMKFSLLKDEKGWDTSNLSDSMKSLMKQFAASTQEITDDSLYEQLKDQIGDTFDARCKDRLEVNSFSVHTRLRQRKLGDVMNCLKLSHLYREKNKFQSQLDSLQEDKKSMISTLSSLDLSAPFEETLPSQIDVLEKEILKLDQQILESSLAYEKETLNQAKLKLQADLDLMKEYLLQFQNLEREIALISAEMLQNQSELRALLTDMLPKTSQDFDIEAALKGTYQDLLESTQGDLFKLEASHDVDVLNNFFDKEKLEFHIECLDSGGFELVRTDFKGLMRSTKDSDNCLDGKFLKEKGMQQLLGALFEDKTLLNEFSDGEFVHYYDQKLKDRRSELGWQLAGSVTGVALPGLGVGQMVSSRSYRKRATHVKARNERILKNVSEAQKLLEGRESAPLMKLKLELDHLSQTKSEHNRTKAEFATKRERLRIATGVAKLLTSPTGPLVSAGVSVAGLGRQIQLQVQEKKTRREVDAMLGDNKVQSADLFNSLKVAYTSLSKSNREEQALVLQVASQMFGLSESKMKYFLENEDSLKSQNFIKLHLNHDKGSVSDKRSSLELKMASINAEFKRLSSEMDLQFNDAGEVSLSSTTLDASRYHDFVRFHKDYHAFFSTAKEMSSFRKVHGLDEFSSQLEQIHLHLNKQMKSRFSQYSLSDLNDFYQRVVELNLGDSSVGKGGISKSFKSSMETFLKKALLENDLDVDDFIHFQISAFNYLSAMKDKPGLYRHFGVSDEAELFQKLDQVMKSLGVQCLMSFSEYRQILHQKLASSSDNQSKFAAAYKAYICDFFAYTDMRNGLFKAAGDRYEKSSKNLMDLSEKLGLSLSSQQEVLFSLFRVGGDFKGGRQDDCVLNDVMNSLSWLKFETKQADRRRLLTQCENLMKAVAFAPKNEIFRNALKMHLKQFLFEDFVDGKAMLKKVPESVPEAFQRAMSSPAEFDAYMESVFASFLDDFTNLNIKDVAKIEETPRAEKDFFAIRSCQLLFDSLKISGLKVYDVSQDQGKLIFSCLHGDEPFSCSLNLSHGEVTIDGKVPKNFSSLMTGFKALAQEVNVDFPLLRLGLNEMLTFDSVKNAYVMKEHFREAYQDMPGFDVFEKQLKDSDASFEPLKEIKTMFDDFASQHVFFKRSIKDKDQQPLQGVYDDLFTGIVTLSDEDKADRLHDFTDYLENQFDDFLKSASEGNVDSGLVSEILDRQTAFLEELQQHGFDTQQLEKSLFFMNVIFKEFSSLLYQVDGYDGMAVSKKIRSKLVILFRNKQWGFQDLKDLDYKEYLVLKKMSEKVFDELDLRKGTIYEQLGTLSEGLTALDSFEKLIRLQQCPGSKTNRFVADFDIFITSEGSDEKKAALFRMMNLYTQESRLFLSRGSSDLLDNIASVFPGAENLKSASAIFEPMKAWIENFSEDIALPSRETMLEVFSGFQRIAQHKQGATDSCKALIDDYVSLKYFTDLMSPSERETCLQRFNSTYQIKLKQTKSVTVEQLCLYFGSSEQMKIAFGEFVDDINV